MALASSLIRAHAFVPSKPAPFTASRVAVAPRIVCQAAAIEAPAQKSKKVHPSPLSTAAPEKYAIVEIGGTQLFVEQGKWYTVNRLKADVGARIKLARVLALKDNGQLQVGRPYLDNVNIEAEVIEELRGPKVLVYKMKPKKHYRRKQGHRQELSRFRVDVIQSSSA